MHAYYARMFFSKNIYSLSYGRAINISCPTYKGVELSITLYTFIT